MFQSRPAVASYTRVGAVLLQEDSAGVEHLITCFSKKLNFHQKWRRGHFKVYIGSSSKVIVHSDHNRLVFLCN